MLMAQLVVTVIYRGQTWSQRVTPDSGEIFENPFEKKLKFFILVFLLLYRNPTMLLMIDGVQENIAADWFLIHFSFTFV